MGALKLEKHQKEEMAGKLQDYFIKERNEELGELASHLLVDFIISELGNAIYNQGIADAHQYMSERVEEMLDLQKY